jgi:hypothetical protein
MGLLCSCLFFFGPPLYCITVCNLLRKQEHKKTFFPLQLHRGSRRSSGMREGRRGWEEQISDRNHKDQKARFEVNCWTYAGDGPYHVVAGSRTIETRSDLGSRIPPSPRPRPSLSFVAMSETTAVVVTVAAQGGQPKASSRHVVACYVAFLSLGEFLFLWVV